MKRILSFCCSFIMAFYYIPAHADDSHKPVTVELIKLLDSHPHLKKMLGTSIQKAHILNPNTKTNPVKSLEDYYQFIDKYSELIPKDELKNPKNITRDRILQSICYFYFLIDQPIDELKQQGLYYNAIQYQPDFSKWLVQFANAWGEFLSTKDSWSDAIYQQFYADPRYGLKEGWYGKGNQWNTFNEFFSRQIVPGARPIAAANDNAVITFPADSVPQGVWRINQDSKIMVDGGIQVKLARYYRVEDLLSADSPYKEQFKNGYLTHTFLNVYDYHRFHFPIGGEVKEVKQVTKNVSLAVSYDAQNNRYVPIDSTGWQFSQTRGYVILETKDYGLVALIPMGMAQVSSVIFDEKVAAGNRFKKGDELGYFLFGGSDFVILFQDKSHFKLTAKKAGDGSFKHGHMGQEYGQLSSKN